MSIYLSQNFDLTEFFENLQRVEWETLDSETFAQVSFFTKVLAEHNNSKDFLESMYTTVAILSIELSATDEGIMNLLQLIDGIQSTAVSSQVSTHFRVSFSLKSMRFKKIQTSAYKFKFDKLSISVLQSLRSENRFNLHSLAILLLAILAMIVNIPDIDIHLDDVVKSRKSGKFQFGFMK